MTGIPIVRIDGDGVGPELTAAGSRLFDAVGVVVDWLDMPAGLGAYDRHGATAPAQTIEAIRATGLAMKGPFSTPNGGSVRSANYYLRRELDLFACVRPLPIDPDRPILLVRENVEDLYSAIEWWSAPGVANAVKIATRAGCERIAHYAFALAVREGREHVTVVHKANNLKLTEGLFLSTAMTVAQEYPQIELREMLADTACSTLVTDPGALDVVLTSNTFGDLLSNLGAAVAGSLGLVGSLNSGTGIHIAEAGHGDAGVLAGRDRVNPLAFLDSVRLLLEAMGLRREAVAARAAITQARAAGPRTLDLGGSARASDVVEAVCRSAAQQLGRSDG